MTKEQLKVANQLAEKIKQLDAFISMGNYILSNATSRIRVEFTGYNDKVAGCYHVGWDEDGDPSTGLNGNVLMMALDDIVQVMKDRRHNLKLQMSRIGSITEETIEGDSVIWVNETGEHEWDKVAMIANKAAKPGSGYEFSDDIDEDDHNTRWAQVMFDHGFSIVEDDDVYQKI